MDHRTKAVQLAVSAELVIEHDPGRGHTLAVLAQAHALLAASEPVLVTQSFGASGRLAPDSPEPSKIRCLVCGHRCVAGGV